MLMRSWQPFTEIETIRQQLDKVFDQRQQREITQKPLGCPLWNWLMLGTTSY
jgi:hypothetical protein